MVEITKVVANRYQVRAVGDETELAGLVASMKRDGFLGALVGRVVELEPGVSKVELAFGHRRCRAAALAGLEEIPVEIQELDDAAMLRLALVENLAREDLTLAEEAAAYERMREEMGLTIRQIAGQVGRSKSHVERLLALSGAAPEVLEAAAGPLGQTGAEAIARHVPLEQQAVAVERLAEADVSAKAQARRVEAARMLVEELDSQQPCLEAVEDPVVRNRWRLLRYCWWNKVADEERFGVALTIVDEISAKPAATWGDYEMREAAQLCAGKASLPAIVEEAGWGCEDCLLAPLREMADVGVPWYGYGCDEEGGSYCAGYVRAGERWVRTDWKWAALAGEAGVEVVLLEGGRGAITVEDALEIGRRYQELAEKVEQARPREQQDAARRWQQAFQAWCEAETDEGSYAALTCDICTFMVDGECEKVAKGRGFGGWLFKTLQRDGDGVMAGVCTVGTRAHTVSLADGAGTLAPGLLEWIVARMGLPREVEDLAGLVSAANEREVAGYGKRARLLNPETLEMEGWARRGMPLTLDEDDED